MLSTYAPSQQRYYRGAISRTNKLLKLAIKDKDNVQIAALKKDMANYESMLKSFLNPPSKKKFYK